MLTFFPDLLAFLRVIVPVIETVLFIGVDVPFLFPAASGSSEGTYENERNVQGASSAHCSLLKMNTASIPD
jgi:hypothetical protein